MTSGIWIFWAWGEGASVKFQKFLTFSDFSFVPKKFSSMTIRTSAYNFYDFMIEPIFIHFVGGSLGGEAPQKILEFFQAVVYFFFLKGVRGRSSRNFLEISWFSDACLKKIERGEVKRKFFLDVIVLRPHNWIKFEDICQTE